MPSKKGDRKRHPLKWEDETINMPPPEPEDPTEAAYAENDEPGQG